MRTTSKSVFLYTKYFSEPGCPNIKCSKLYLASKRASSVSCSGVLLTVFVWKMLSRNVINDILGCMNMCVCILYMTAVIMGITEIFMALLTFFTSQLLRGSRKFIVIWPDIRDLRRGEHFKGDGRR
jgi:uncharacterized membrane protein